MREVSDHPNRDKLAEVATQRNHMKMLSKTAASAVLLLAFLLPTAVAGAQTYPSPPPPDLPQTDGAAGGADEECVPDEDTVDSDGPAGVDDEVACDEGAVLPTNEETTPSGGGEAVSPGGAEEGEVGPTGNDAGAAAGVETAPSGSLPITGGDVVGLVVMGGAALAIGGALVARSRRMRGTAT